MSIMKDKPSYCDENFDVLSLTDIFASLYKREPPKFNPLGNNPLAEKALTFVSYYSSWGVQWVDPHLPRYTLFQSDNAINNSIEIWKDVNFSEFTESKRKK